MSDQPVIDSLRSNIRLLMEENRKLEAENGKLRKTGERHKNQCVEMAETIAGLEKRLSVLELSESLTGESANSRIARARINRLMREVDKCIALLNG